MALAAIFLALLMSAASQSGRPVTVTRDALEMECLLAAFGSEGGRSVARIVCGAEYSATRTCYVFASSFKFSTQSEERTAEPVRYKSGGTQHWLKLSRRGEWLRFDAMTNHFHLFADSRQLPARPDVLALTVCAGLPAHSQTIQEANVAPRRVAVFFYGLFMDVDLLRSKGAQPANVRQASVAGFGLRIGQRATLVPVPNSRVFGMLMELSQAEIEQLYSEASVSAYRPEAVLAELPAGSKVPALCFNLVNEPLPGETNPEYAAKLRQLAARIGLPEKYVGSIR